MATYPTDPHLLHMGPKRRALLFIECATELLENLSLGETDETDFATAATAIPGANIKSEDFRELFETMLTQEQRERVVFEWLAFTSELSSLKPTRRALLARLQTLAVALGVGGSMVEHHEPSALDGLALDSDGNLTIDGRRVPRWELAERVQSDRARNPDPSQRQHISPPCQWRPCRSGVRSLAWVVAILCAVVAGMSTAWAIKLEIRAHDKPAMETRTAYEHDGQVHVIIETETGAWHGVFNHQTKANPPEGALVITKRDQSERIVRVRFHGIRSLDFSLARKEMTQ